MIRVEVAYARPDQQRLVELELPPGTTAGEALEHANLAAEFPELATGEPDIGIFSRPVTPDTVLSPGDRVEVYRPLQVDPKAQRRDRARRQRAGQTRQA